MKKGIYYRTLAAALLILIFYAIPQASAAESHKILADSWYRQANDYYNSGDCINAIDAAKKALNYYLMDGDTEGAIKTTDLIGKVKDCLKKAGDTFYQQAATAYNSGKYEDAISWAKNAKQQFDAIPDNLSSQKCEDVIRRSEDKIRGDLEGRANRTYQEAVKFYESDDLPNAKSKANDALEMFKQAGNADGIKQAEALISAIDKRIFELTDFANKKIAYATDLYREAMDSKDFKQFLEVKKNAEEAKSLYQKAGDSQGYNTSSQLLDATRNEIAKLEDTVNNMAEKKVEEGRNEYLFGQGSKDKGEELAHYENASRSYTEAKNLYYELYTWARERFDENKQKFYQGRLNDVEGKLNDVKKAQDEINTRDQAEELYKDANTFFTKGECRNASISAKDAKSKFQGINDQAGMFKCETLLYQIDDCVKKIVDAESHLRNASEYIKVADYANATNETDKAMTIYTEIKNEEGKNNATEYKKNISRGQEKKTEADKLMAKAEFDFGKNSFDESRMDAENAKSIFREINYLEGINRSEDLIKKNDKRIAEVSEEARRNMMILVGAIVLALVIVVFSGYSRRVKRHKMQIEEIERQELARQHEAERTKQAERIAEEQRAREMEAERQKLKAMIADEMKKVEQEKRGAGQA